MRRLAAKATAFLAISLCAGTVSGCAPAESAPAAVASVDLQLQNALDMLIASAAIGSKGGEIRLEKPMSDSRFMEPNSGLYFQISSKGQPHFPSRSLWDRTLSFSMSGEPDKTHFRISKELEGETLRIAERTVTLPGSQALWTFMVAQGVGAKSNSPQPNPQGAAATSDEEPRG